MMPKQRPVRCTRTTNTIAGIMHRAAELRSATLYKIFLSICQRSAQLGHCHSPVCPLRHVKYFVIYVHFNFSR